MAEPVFETKMLTDVYCGIYTVTSYFNDGTSETREVPGGGVWFHENLVSGMIESSMEICPIHSKRKNQTNGD